VGDLERLTSRVTQGLATVRDFLTLASGLRTVSTLVECLGRGSHTVGAPLQPTSGEDESWGTPPNPRSPAEHPSSPNTQDPTPNTPLAALAATIDDCADVRAGIENAVEEDEAGGAR